MIAGKLGSLAKDPKGYWEDKFGLGSPDLVDPGARPLYPNMGNLTAGTQGLLQEPYVLKDRGDVELVSTMGDINKRFAGSDATLAELKNRALAQGPTQQAKYLTEAQQLEELQSMGKAGASARKASSSAFSDLARGGGLSTGARERLARQSSRDLASSMQEVRGQGAKDRLNILAQDEAQKLGLLSALPGQENQATSIFGNLAQGEAQRAEGLGLSNRGYSTDVEKLNQQRALDEIARVDQNKLAKYQEEMRAYAAAQQANAIAMSGQKSGGGKGMGK